MKSSSKLHGLKLLKILMVFLFILCCIFFVVIIEYFIYEKPFPFPVLAMTQEEKDDLHQKMIELACFQENINSSREGQQKKELTLNSKELVAILEGRHPELKNSARFILKPNIIQFEFRFGRGIHHIRIQGDLEKLEGSQDLQLKNISTQSFRLPKIMRTENNALNYFKGLNISRLNLEWVDRLKSYEIRDDEIVYYLQ